MNLNIYKILVCAVNINLLTNFIFQLNEVSQNTRIFVAFHLRISFISGGLKDIEKIFNNHNIPNKLNASFDYSSIRLILYFI